MSIVSVKGVVKHFMEGEHRVRAVDGVDLELAKGDFAALAGPSGSGKTTLLNLIGGLDRADSGEITLDGEAVHEKSADALTGLRLRKVGFVFQSYNLIPVLTAYENVQFVLQIQGVPEQEHDDRILPVFKALGIEGFARRFPTQMSGGQQQRVAVARAVAGRPAIVLADEPTANLDSETAKGLLDHMRGLNEGGGVTFLFSSHDPLVLEKAARIIRMRDGKVHADERK